MKKEWKQPELTTLWKTLPEEAMVLGCKLRTTATGAQNADNPCLKASDPQMNGGDKPYRELRFS